MPNSVQYSETAVTNALGVGDMHIGAPASGPTQTSGFYAGINPPSGGYTVYINKQSGGPSIVCPANDADLITFTESLTGESMADVNACFAYFASQDDKMVMNTPIGNMVTNGLNIIIDPSNALSWPGSGTTLYDLSGNANNVTLYNSAAVNSDGFLELDGVDDYGQITNNSTLQGWAHSQSLAMWLYHDIESGRRNPWDQAYGGYGTWTHEQGNQLSQYFGDAGSNSQPYVGYSSADVPENRWTLMTTVRGTSDTTGHKWYRNGELTYTRSNPYGILTQTNANPRIGRGYAGYWAGRMGKIMTWESELTDSDVKALWIGADITANDLKFAINPSSIGSYEGGTTTAYSLTGSDSGTLYNGVGFVSHFAGGVWEFDSVDDYINLPNDVGYSTNSVSVFAWYKINGNPTGGYHIICGGQELEMSIHQSATYLRNGVYTTSGRSVSNNGNVTLNDGKFHYYGFTFDGSTKRAYIDGVEVGTQSVSGTLTTNFSNRNLGRFGGSTTYYANGDMGLFTIHNKVLSASEIQQNYNASINQFN